MTTSQIAITTVDNPFDPFDQFDDWYKYDCDCGYNTCSYLARLTNTSDSLSDGEYKKEVERAIDKIIENDPAKLYKKVYKTVVVPD